jgi:hypothetical protein
VAVWVAKSSFGNAPGRNGSARSPWNLSENVTLARTLRFGENVRLDIRGEAFNLFTPYRFGSMRLER